MPSWFSRYVLGIFFTKTRVSHKYYRGNVKEFFNGSSFRLIEIFVVVIDRNGALLNFFNRIVQTHNFLYVFTEMWRACIIIGITLLRLENRIFVRERKTLRGKARTQSVASRTKRH